MKASVFLAILSILLGAVPAGAKPVFQYNDQRYELSYAYAFRLNMSGSRHQADGDSAHTTSRGTLAVALSNQPFDTIALKSAEPLQALARMGLAGALVLTAVPGDSGRVSLLRISIPGSDRILQPDPRNATMHVDRAADGKVTGRLVIWTDDKLRKTNPKKVPLLGGDLAFEAAAPDQQ